MRQKRLIIPLIAGLYLIAGSGLPTMAQSSVSPTEQSQTASITGIVVDEQGLPMPGVSIRIKESNRGGINREDGTFNIPLQPGDRTLIFSYVGMIPQEITIPNDHKPLRIVLREDSELLGEVVVTGYQTISKERATGSYAVLDTKDLKKKLQPSIISRLEGQVAGLTQNARGDMYIRGIATLYGAQQPLIVVDGMPYEGSLSDINPAMITNISVLKDAAASSIYGARAANGVIVVSTLTGEANSAPVVSYDGSIQIVPIPDYSKLNLMSSRELVEQQRYGITLDENEYESVMKYNRYMLNPVYEALLKQKAGLATDAETDAVLNHYAGLDNRKQLRDFYMRTGIVHNHNVSISGGSGMHTFAAGVDYTGSRPNNRHTMSDKVGLSLKDRISLTDRLTLSMGVAATFDRTHTKLGAGTYYDKYYGTPSYYMLRDESGAPITKYNRKSEKELQRLISRGLYDEHYSPITNLDRERNSTQSSYYRFNVGLHIDLLPGLSFDGSYATEREYQKEETVWDKNSYTVINMINNAATIDSETGDITYNVPEGGQLHDQQGRNSSYTLRGQFNYRLERGDHYITALAGAERRRVHTTSTSAYYMGYDPNSLAFVPIDPILLADLDGTEAPGGYFTWEYGNYNYITELEDRYISFYANASYTFQGKYDLSGSIRMDQSNLFGTDPKYQYRPLWSIGGTWHMAEEGFMRGASPIDRLNLRLTYGIGGNVPKNAGPFLTLHAKQYNPLIEDFSSAIKNPPNASLRWEKTATTNAGIDLSLWRNKLNASIDLYYKYTTDLLAYRQADPTLGHNELMLNYGSMLNRGAELSLSGTLTRGAFSWTPSLTFGMNFNRMLNVEESDPSTFRYTGGSTTAVGYPIGSVFSYRFAGLDRTSGEPTYYTAEGDIVRDITELKDLRYMGPSTPVYTGALTNSFSFHDFDLSFMLVYYGGHYFRAETASYAALPRSGNAPRENLNSWRKPEDSDNPDATPAFTGIEVDTIREHAWMASDRNTLPGDYLKLRDLTIGYSLPAHTAVQWGIKSARVMVQLQNLLTITANKKGFDPESMTTYMYGWGMRGIPQPITVTVGASIQF